MNNIQNQMYHIELENCNLPFETILVEDIDELRQIIQMANQSLTTNFGRLIITSTPIKNDEIKNEIETNTLK